MNRYENIKRKYNSVAQREKVLVDFFHLSSDSKRKLKRGMMLLLYVKMSQNFYKKKKRAATRFSANLILRLFYEIAQVVVAKRYIIVFLSRLYSQKLSNFYFYANQLT